MNERRGEGGEEREGTRRGSKAEGEEERSSGRGDTGDEGRVWGGLEWSGRREVAGERWRSSL